MKIFKLAQDSGVPDGFVKIRLRIRSNGTVKREIVRGGKSKCHEGADQLLEELLNIDVPGYEGGFASLEDGGKTDEFYEQNAVKPRSKPAKQEIKEEDFEPLVPGIQQEEGQLDTGYGV